MLEFIHRMSTEKFHKYICNGICAYMVLHVVLLYIVQFGFLDYFAINVLQTLFMLAFIFLYISAIASKNVLPDKQPGVFLGKLFRKDISHIWLNDADILVLLLAFWGMISSCFAYDKDIALYGAETRNEGLFAWFAYYLLFYAASFLKNDDKKKCLKFFSLLGTVMLLSGIICSYTGVGYVLSGRPMAYVPLLHQNMYAGFCVLFFGVHIGWAIFSGKKKERIYAFILSVISIAAILCSTSSLGSVSGVFILLVLIGMSVLFDRKKEKALWRRLGVSVLGMILAVCIFIPLIDKTNHNLLSQDADNNAQLIEEHGANGMLNGRIDHWIAGVRALPDYWLVGVGIDNFEKIIDDYAEDDSLYSVRTAHNEYIQLVCTEGAAALLFYLLLLAVIFFSGIRQWRERQDASMWVQRGAFLAFMGYICQAFVSFSSVAVTPFFWLLMGMISLSRKNT